jgi:hypothetical protein
MILRLQSRQRFNQLSERPSDEEFGHVQYDANAESVTVFVDGNGGHQYAARPPNDHRYNKVGCVFRSYRFVVSIHKYKG